MAFIQNIEAYTAAVTGRYGGISEKGALSGDSSQRNFVGRQMQWVKDNGLELGDPAAQENFDKFMELVNSKVSDKNGFALGDGGLFWIGNEKEIGGTEFAALGNMMQQLQCLQQDGKITMEEYAAHMTTLFSQETMDSLENNGKGEFMNLAQNIEDLEDRPKDPEIAAQNADRMSVAIRPVINDLGDYKDIIAERRGNDAPVYGSVDESKNAAYDAVKAARDAGQITDEQFNAMQDYIRNDMAEHFDPNTGMRANNTDVVAYAIEDALATGDQSVIDRFMDPETLKGIQKGGFDGLSDLDRAARSIEVHSDTLTPEAGAGPDIGGVADGAASGVVKGAAQAVIDTILVTSLGAMANNGYFEKDPETNTYPGIEMLGDTMMCNYFDPKDGSEPPKMTADEYFETLDRYEQMPPSDQLDFRNANPDFMEIHNAVNRIDLITVAMAEAADAGDISRMNAAIQSITGTGDAGIAISDVAVAIQQVADGQGRDLSEIMMETHSDGIDHDAEMTQEDLDILQQKSPMDRFEDIKAATVAVWKGDYDSEPRRTENLRDAGFSDDEIKRIQNIVNISAEGNNGTIDFCRNLTAEQYDELYAAQDGGTLADRTADFNARQLEAASKMMTYEGGGDYMTAHNADGGQMTREEADQLYADAADIATAGVDGGQELGQAEAAENLALYVSEGGEAAFEGHEKNACAEQQTAQQENEGADKQASDEGIEMA